jgi:predicted helicase
MRNMVSFYNSQIGKEIPDYDSAKISWSSSLETHRVRGDTALYEEFRIADGLYRPFTKQFTYFGDKMIHRRGQFNDFFPTADAENLLICVSGLGGTRIHSVLISNVFTDLNSLDSGTQCFPLYYYEVQEQKGKNDIGQTVLGGKEITANYKRKDGVSDFILEQAKNRYGAEVGKEDVFYYVYGFLHSPEYRTTFADDLKKSLPRIPLAEKAGDFWAFSKAGRELANLHLNYESVKPLDEVAVTGDRTKPRVEKMRFLAKDRKDVIIYNPHVRIDNIPAKAYEYIVNGKSAVEWVMERYQVKTDKDSGIVNDPNLYAEETGKPSYILDLLLSVIAVSVRTVEIVEGLAGIEGKPL